MPELPPKRSGDIASFDRLSRLIGDGSLRPHGDKPTRNIPRSRGVGPDHAVQQAAQVGLDPGAARSALRRRVLSLRNGSTR